MLPTWAMILGGHAAAQVSGPSPSLIATAPWEALASVKGTVAGTVEVYRAQVGGTPCFRGTAQVDGVTADTLLEVVTDIDGETRWSTAGLLEGKVLSRTSNSIDYYQVLDIPDWTLARDRLWFLRGTIGSSGATRTFSWTPLVAGAPHRGVYDDVRERYAGAIEAAVNVGGWTFEPADGGGVRMAYVVCSDGGGRLPLALQSFATRRSLPQTVGDVVQQARRIQR